MDEKISAIIVTYHPEPRALGRLLDALHAQMAQIVVVDNGPGLGMDLPPGVALISMGGNAGIAAAQNVGIVRAREMGASHVLLFDQDSEPAPDMVAVLSRALRSLPDAACVGPRYRDARQDNPPPFIRVEGLKLRRCACEDEDTVVAVDYLIASGCLIPMKVIDAVGAMREDFFIDYVDIEWGLRAKMRGWQSYGVCAAYMAHNLGDAPLRFLGKAIPLHSPLRHYYHVRNALCLYRQRGLPLNWKLVDGARMVLKFGFYSLFTRPRLEHFRMMCLGVWDGLRGRLGKYQAR